MPMWLAFHLTALSANFSQFDVNASMKDLDLKFHHQRSRCTLCPNSESKSGIRMTLHFISRLSHLPMSEILYEQRLLPFLWLRTCVKQSHSDYIIMVTNLEGMLFWFLVFKRAPFALGHWALFITTKSLSLSWLLRIPRKGHCILLWLFVFTGGRKVGHRIMIMNRLWILLVRVEGFVLPGGWVSGREKLVSTAAK